MNSSKIYLGAGFIIVSLLGWQLWNAVVHPLQEKLFVAYINQATSATVKGDLTTARSWLASASKLPVDTSRSTQLSVTIDRLAADPRAERDFMNEHGNMARVALLDAVLQTYETPKAQLEAAGQLFTNHEERLARILLTQAVASDHEYAGAAVMDSYVSSLGE